MIILARPQPVAAPARPKSGRSRTRQLRRVELHRDPPHACRVTISRAASTRRAEGGGPRARSIRRARRVDASAGGPTQSPRLEDTRLGIVFIRAARGSSPNSAIGASTANTILQGSSAANTYEYRGEPQYTGASTYRLGGVTTPHARAFDHHARHADQRVTGVQPRPDRSGAADTLDFESGGLPAGLNIAVGDHIGHATLRVV